MVRQFKLVGECVSDNYLYKISEKIENDLLPGEIVTHAVLAFRVGGSREVLMAGSPSVGTVLGLTAGSAAAELYGQELAIPRRIYVVLTTERLMIYTLGGMAAARPGQLVYGLPLEEIAWLAEPSREGSLAYVLRVDLGMTNGARLRWEFPRVQVNKGMELLITLRQYVPDEKPRE